MSIKIERFNEDYFKSLKTLEEKEKYVMDFIHRWVNFMDKGGE